LRVHAEEFILHPFHLHKPLRRAPYLHRNITQTTKDETRTAQ
jgi:hypothetical protein